MHLILAIFLVLFILALGSIIFYSMSYGISPMPSSSKAIKVILQAIPIRTSSLKIFELGSGWGSLAFALAKRYPHCVIYAYEISFVPWFVSRLIQSIFHLKNVKIFRQDFFQVSLREASVIVCYLYPGAMQRLRKKFEIELQPDVWIVSHAFAIPGWQPIKMYQLNDLYRTPIYVYYTNLSFDAVQRAKKLKAQVTSAPFCK